MAGTARPRPCTGRSPCASSAAPSSLPSRLPIAASPCHSCLHQTQAHPVQPAHRVNAGRRPPFDFCAIFFSRSSTSLCSWAISCLSFSFSCLNCFALCRTSSISASMVGWQLPELDPGEMLPEVDSGAGSSGEIDIASSFAARRADRLTGSPLLATFLPRRCCFFFLPLLPELAGSLWRLTPCVGVVVLDCTCSGDCRHPAGNHRVLGQRSEQTKSWALWSVSDPFLSLFEAFGIRTPSSEIK